jgi:integrase
LGEANLQVVRRRALRRYRERQDRKSQQPDICASFSPLNNVLTRHIKPAARALGIGFVNWQVLSRSFATHLKRTDADVKDAQVLMRHSRASTTLDVYQQFIPESQRRVADGLIPKAHSKTHSVSFQ